MLFSFLVLLIFSDVHPEEFTTIFPQHQVVYTGEIIYIRCNTFTDPLWLFDDEPFDSHGISDFLLEGNQTYSMILIESAMDTHSGKYTCLGSLQNGSFVASAIVYVAAKGRGDYISSKNKIARIGEIVRLECYSMEETYWFFNKKQEAPQTKPIHDEPKYIMHNVDSDKEGYYYCLIHNMGVWILEESKLEILVQPSIVVPVAQQVKTTVHVLFRCYSEQPSIASWLHNNGKLPSNCYQKHVSDYNYLIIHNTLLSNRGYYSCITKINGILEGQHGVLFVTEPMAPPHLYPVVDLLIQVPRIVTAKLFSSVSILCSSSYPALWTFQSGALPYNTINGHDLKSFNKTYGSFLNFLLIVNATYENSGVYVCANMDKYGSTLVLISDKDDIAQKNYSETQLDPVMLKAATGSKVIFKCPVPTPVLWIYNQQMLPNNAEVYDTGISGSILYLHNVRENNSGMYYCYEAVPGLMAEASGKLLVQSLNIDDIDKIQNDHIQLDTKIQMIYPKSPVPEGTTAGVYCYSEEPVTWYFQGKPISDYKKNGLIRKKSLSTINSIKPIYIYYLIIPDSRAALNTGIYTCHYTINGSKYYDDGVIIVTEKQLQKMDVELPGIPKERVGFPMFELSTATDRAVFSLSIGEHFKSYPLYSLIWTILTSLSL